MPDTLPQGFTTPNQLALHYKSDLEATGAFVVESDGRVRMAANRGGGYAPPWVWAGAIPEASGNDPQSIALRVKLSTPSSDPSSPWRSSVPYSAGGPFTKHSAWDSSTGKYEGGIDWGTLLGTIGVGAMFAAPAIAAVAGGGGAAGGAGAAGAGAAESGAGAGAIGGGASTLSGLYAPAAAGLGPMAAGETGMAATEAALGGGVPASLAAPTTVGAVYGAAPAAAASTGSKAVGALTSPNIWSTVLSNAFGFLGAKNSSDASLQAAQIQANSADKAATLAAQAQANSLAFQQRQWDTQQTNMAPWLKTGQGAITTLGRLLGIGGPTSTAPAAPAGAPSPGVMAAAAPGTMAGMYGGAGAPARSAQASPSYVRIAWGDGSKDTVPASSLEQYKLLGAEAV